jgi:hypothetical protein
MLLLVIKNGKIKPHKKLVDSKNCFLHALFYILKDIRNSNPKDFEVESESYWLDPDVEAFSHKMSLKNTLFYQK